MENIKKPTSEQFPYDLDAEKAILGILISRSEKILDIIGDLEESDFYLNDHRIIFRGILSLFEESEGKKDFKVDILKLKEVILSLNKDSKITLAYLSSLSEYSSSYSNLEVYVDIVKKKATLRKIINFSRDVYERCLHPSQDPVELLRNIEEEFFEISNKKDRGEIVSVGDLVDTYYNEIVKTSDKGRQEAISGVETGFHNLDLITTGFHPGELIIIAARPSMGKTSLALNIALNARKAGRNCSVAFFSLEMSKKQILLRFLSSLANVEYKKLYTGVLKGELEAVKRGIQILKKLKIYVDDTSGITILELKSKLKKLMVVEREGIDLVIVDYLQLMQGERDFKVREQEISYISRGLKAIAKEFNVPVIALSQLNRAPEIRKGDHRPQLSDLRESGSIEQDADMVLFIYRPDKYGEFLDEENGRRGNAEIIIGKNRNGELGKVELAFVEKFATFKPLAKFEDNN